MKILDYPGLQSFWTKAKHYVDTQLNALWSSVVAALSDGSVKKVGTTTVGGSARPVFLNAGTPTACTATVGSDTKPVYMKSGTVTAAATTVGGAAKPVYMNAGELTACSSSVGSGTNPVYMSAGTIRSSSSSSGSEQFPVYLDAGTITPCPGVPTLILSGWVANNGSTTGWNASYTRCFDSSVTKAALALTRVSAGVVRIKIPTALSGYIGYSGSLIHVHGLAANGGRSFSWDLTTSDYITVYCYNGNTPADAAFWIDVYYIHGAFPRLS